MPSRHYRALAHRPVRLCYVVSSKADFSCLHKRLTCSTLVWNRLFSISRLPLSTTAFCCTCRCKHARPASSVARYTFMNCTTSAAQSSTRLTICRPSAHHTSGLAPNKQCYCHQFQSAGARCTAHCTPQVPQRPKQPVLIFRTATSLDPCIFARTSASLTRSTCAYPPECISA